MNDLTVGETRKFTFSDKTYKIREILNQPEIEMEWTYNTGVCPHCKKRITSTTKHKFWRIEILGDNSVSDDDKLTAENIVMVGFTMDKRMLALPIDIKEEAFQKSEKFKKLKKEV